MTAILSRLIPKMKRVLVVTSSRDVHADLIIPKISEAGAEVFRVNSDYLGLKHFFSFGDERSKLVLDGKEVDLLSINSVWYRKPEVYKRLRSIKDLTAQLAITETSRAISSLESLTRDLVLWVSRPSCIRMADQKIYQLKVAKKLGFKIPKTLVTNNYRDALDFFSRSGKDCVVKSLVGGAKLGIYVGGVTTKKLTRESVGDLRKVNYSPVIIQERLKKKFELRVTVIGNKVFAVRLDSQKMAATKLDWRKDVENLPHDVYQLPDDVLGRVRRLVDFFGLSYSAMDFVVTVGGELVFLENNPNGQFLWLEDRLPELKMTEAMVNLLVRDTR